MAFLSITRILNILLLTVFFVLTSVYPLSKTEIDDLLSKKHDTNTQNTPPILSEVAQVQRVIDGDTISVNIAGKKQTVRIIGINTPETVDPRKEVECFGQEASNFAKTFFGNAGTELILQIDPSQTQQDKYGRLLRYVSREDNGQDYGLSAIENGFAYEYTYDIPYRYQEKYRAAQEVAQSNKTGLWADSACSGKL